MHLSASGSNVVQSSKIDENFKFNSDNSSFDRSSTVFGSDMSMIFHQNGLKVLLELNTTNNKKYRKYLTLTLMIIRIESFDHIEKY